MPDNFFEEANLLLDEIGKFCRMVCRRGDAGQMQRAAERLQEAFTRAATFLAAANGQLSVVNDQRWGRILLASHTEVGKAILKQHGILFRLVSQKQSRTLH